MGFFHPQIPPRAAEPEKENDTPTDATTAFVAALGEVSSAAIVLRYHANMIVVEQQKRARRERRIAWAIAAVAILQVACTAVLLLR